MRLSSSVALVASAAVIAALLPVVSAEAVSAAPTCQGQRATIVGDPADPELYGTAGDDVIVTRGVARVLASGGADRICVTGANSQDGETTINAGPGDDRVRIATSRTGRLNARLGDGDDRMDVATTPTHRIYVYLGQGADVYRGGSGPDFVNADHGSPTDEHDRISTGAGPDDVKAGRWGMANHDDVELGAGDDHLQVHGWLTPDTRPSGGAGSDRLDVRWGPCLGTSDNPDCTDATPWVIDNRRGVATADGVVRSRWSGFEVFQPYTWIPGPLTFIGSVADEVVSAGDGLVGATMGSGDDSLEIPPARIDHRRKISGGPGRDTLEVHGHGMTVDLAAGAMWERRRGSATDPAVRFGAFENAAITGSQGLTLIGDGGDNVLRAFGCNVKADGGAGDDALSVFPGLMAGDVVPCAPTARDVHFDGGPGDDVLRGGSGPDHLNGGVGVDTADGRRGSDVCLAEVRRNCER